MLDPDSNGVPGVISLPLHPAFLGFHRKTPGGFRLQPSPSGSSMPQFQTIRERQDVFYHRFLHNCSHLLFLAGSGCIRCPSLNQPLVQGVDVLSGRGWEAILFTFHGREWRRENSLKEDRILLGREAGIRCDGHISTCPLQPFLLRPLCIQT